MATYLILNLAFMAFVVLLLRIKPRNPSRAWWVTLLVLLIMTAVFDSLIVGLDIVNYDKMKLLGLYVGRAPVEDFFYTILAVLIIPVLWKRLGKKHD